MDFKEILERWEASSGEGKAAGNSRLSRMIKEKDAGLHESETRTSNGYRTGRASLGRLKAMRPEAELDLHGVTGSEARSLVEAFLRAAVDKRMMKVRIVHGRGLHSSDGKAVLKEVVREVLERSPLVRAHGNPPPAEGGSGAVWVILQRG